MIDGNDQLPSDREDGGLKPQTEKEPARTDAPPPPPDEKKVEEDPSEQPS